MKYEGTTIDPGENSSPQAEEVEFALLLSHVINTVKQDPEQLRLTIYDFARTKLKNDLSGPMSREEGLTGRVGNRDSGR